MRREYPYGAVPNLIDYESRVFATSTGEWSADGLLERVRESHSSSDLSFITSTTNGTSTEFQLSYVVIPVNLQGNAVRFHCYVQVSEAANLSLTLTIDGNGGGTWNYPGVSVRQDQWTLLSVTSDVTSYDPSPFTVATASVSIEAVWDDSDVPHVLSLKNPSVTIPAAVVDNVSALETYARLPEYMRDADGSGEFPDVPLFRFIETLMALTDDIDKKRFSFRYEEPEPLTGLAKPSRLAQPEFADLLTLYWLAQLVGVTLIDPRTGLTSWTSLMTAADSPPSGDGDGNPTWTEWTAAVDSPDLGNTMSWSEIQGFDVDSTGSSPEQFLEFIRWQVVTRAYGLRAGSTASLKDVLTRALKTGADYSIQPHADGDPWSIRITVNEVDILGESQENLEELLKPWTPAGYEVIVNAS